MTYDLNELQALLHEWERAEDRLSASGSDRDLLKALNAREAFEQACGEHGGALIADYQALQARVAELEAEVVRLRSVCASSANAVDAAICCIIEERDLPDSVLRKATEAMMALHAAALGDQP